MKVSIDAKILIPNLTKFPAAIIQLRDFNKLDLKNIAIGFLGENIRITSNGYLTKEELSDNIINIKKDILELEQEPESEEKSSLIEQLKMFLQEFENQLSNYTEFDEMPEIDWNGLSSDVSNIVLTSVDNDMTSTVFMENSETSTESFIAYYKGNYRYLTEKGYDSIMNYRPYEDIKPKGMSLDIQTAKNIADSQLHKIGIRNMDYYGYSIRPKENVYEPVESSNECFVLHYTRTIEGAPTTYTNLRAQYSGEYDELWNYEFMSFYIDDSGILAFTWDNPKDVTQIINTNVKLLPFGNIKQVFRDQISIRNKWLDERVGYYDETSISITRIELGMMVIKSKDTKGQYLAVPVWDFFGSYSMVKSDKAVEEYHLDSKYKDDKIFNSLSYLTINAVDGSVIDRNYGF